MTKLNLLDKDAVTYLLNSVCPDVIIHCAAERFPDKVESDPQAAYDLNVGVLFVITFLIKIEWPLRIIFKEQTTV